MKTNSKNSKPNAKRGSSLESTVKRIHNKTREEVRGYFNKRGINNDSIDKYVLGLGEVDGYYGYVIPIFDVKGKVAYVKIRRAPEYDTSETLADMMGQDNPNPKWVKCPADAKYILVGEDQLAKSASTDVLVCRGELDRIVAIQEGVKMPVVTGGNLIRTFKDEWIEALKNMRNIYLCLGESDVSKRGAEELAKRMAEKIPTASIYMISLPSEEGELIDITDYFVSKRGTVDELFTKYAVFYCGAKPIDPSQFKEMTVEDIANVLNSTIKYDFVSKVITFLTMLLAYTEEDQLNVMFNADSSTGKTYICKEVSKYFPEQDVKDYGKTSPKSFYYSPSLQSIDEKTGQTIINLERRILIFSEQPDPQLQENLRPVLSHDGKRSNFSITNKNSGGRNVAMEGYILGYPSTFFCSANMHVNEQELTRCLILSPESTPEKIMAGIDVAIAKGAKRSAYNALVNDNEERRMLMERVIYVKNLNADYIDIDDDEYMKAKFMENLKTLPKEIQEKMLVKNSKVVSPELQRAINHFMSLIKAMALVNASSRMVDGRVIATRRDIDEAIKLWVPLSKSKIYGISPQALDFYTNIILPAYYAKNKETGGNVGVTYEEIRTEYYFKKGRYPNMDNMRDQWIPMLETASMVSIGKSKADKRRYCIEPLVFFSEDLEEEK